MSDGAAAWLELFGRLHPLVLHLPIGLLAGLAVLEVVAMVRRSAMPREVTRILAAVTAGAAALAAGTGYVLAREGAEVGQTLVRHQQLGIALAIACLVTALIHWASESRRAYRLALLVTVGLLIPVGHLGGSMTHGESFVTAPLARVLRTTALALDPAGEMPAQRAYARVDTQPAQAEVAAAPASPPAATTEVAHPQAQEPSVQQALLTQSIEGAAAAPDSFASRIEPILKASCVGCHGSARQKGGLALHTLAAMSAGGKSGPVFLAGRPESSEILRRVLLPVDDKQHMPPAGKPQLSTDQVQILADWIASRAESSPTPTAPEPTAPNSVTLVSAVGPAEPVVSEPLSQPPPPGKPVEKSGPTQPNASALNTLREHLVHFESVAPGSDLLVVNFAATAASTTDEVARRLLEPLLDNLDTLSLSQCLIGDETAALLARAPRLRRLDLRGTSITNAALARIRDLPRLEELVLARTRLSDEAISHLAAMAGLKRVFVWNAGLTEKAVADLRSRRPDLVVNAGDFQEATAQEVEPEIKLTSDAPPPGEPAKASAVRSADAPGDASVVALRPVNTVCPVSGSPVDPRFAVVHKDRVIGFCCPNCPGAFWKDPAKFEAKLTAANGN